MIDPNLLARIQSMVDTLAHTRVLQKQLNQARAERHHHQQHSRYQQQQSNTVVRSINGVTAGQLEDDTKLIRVRFCCCCCVLNDLLSLFAYCSISWNILVFLEQFH